MRPRALAAILLALLVLPSGSATWSQYRGGPDRNGVAPFAGGPLDVIFNASREETFYPGFPTGAPALVTPHGTIFEADEDGECLLHIYANATDLEPRRLPIEDCTNGAFTVAYDAASDAVVLCIYGDVGRRQLQAIDPVNGDLKWGFSASALPQSPGFVGWGCLGAAFDAQAREVVVIFFALAAQGLGNAYYLASIEADTGALRWASPVHPAGARGLPVPDVVPGAANPPLFGARSVALTTTGVVVMAVEPGASEFVNGFVANLLTFRRSDGAPTGSFRATEPTASSPTDPTRAPAASSYASARGPLAALAFGGDVVVVNPELGSIIARGPITAADPSFSYIWWPTGAWTSDRILIPLPHSVSAFDPTTLELAWTFSEGFDWSVREILVTASHELLVFIGRPSTGDGAIVILDVATGAVGARIPVPFYVPPESASAAEIAAIQMVPLDDGGILAFDQNANRSVLGRAPPDRVPQIGVTPEYPGVAESFTVEVGSVADRRLTRIEVQWGDGTIEQATPGVSLTHAFPSGGPRTIRVMAVYDDGLTGTAVRTIHVGGTPPPQLTALQRAFSPDNQELTFFLLGTLLTIIGVAFTVGRHRRRFAKLERELAAVEEIRMLSAQDPRGAVMALKSYRDRLPSDLARRRIDDSQYQVLDLRSARLLKVLRTRMFAPYDSRLSTRFHRLLDAAFEDAILQPSEKVALVAALEAEEGLRASDREEIAKILEDFTTERVDLHAR